MSIAPVSSPGSLRLSSPHPLTYLAVPLGSTCIPDLDAHLVATSSTGIPLIFPATLQRGDVFEISGGPKSGKTHLLYWLVINCILPSKILVSAPGRSPEYVLLGGWGKVAVVCDCDGRWDARRLHTLLVSRLEHLVQERNLSPSQPIEALARVALNRLVLYRLGDTFSSLRLIATLHALPTYLRTTWPEEGLGLLAVDSMSATIWQDRLRHEGKANTQQPLLSALASIRAPLTALSTWSAPHAPSPLDRSLASPLQVSHEITLAPGVTALPKFPTGVTPREALADVDRRAMVERGLILGQVRTLHEHDRVGRFRFEIHADEIVMS